MSYGEYTGYDPKAIGRRLKAGMADAGLTAGELAERIGKSRFAVQDWLSGRSVPSLETATQICDVFGWPIDRLCVRGDWKD